MLKRNLKLANDKLLIAQNNGQFYAHKKTINYRTNTIYVINIFVFKAVVNAVTTNEFF